METAEKLPPAPLAAAISSPSSLDDATPIVDASFTRPDGSLPAVSVTLFRTIALISLVLICTACRNPAPSPEVRVAAEQETRRMCGPGDERCHDCTPPPLRRLTRERGWSVVCGTEVARYEHTATLLEDGRILIAGGESYDRGVLSTTELYDPETGRWSLGPSLNHGRVGHRATMLPDGRVLVTGGHGTNFETIASAEVYDPAHDRWTEVASMSHGRVHHRATHLDDGRILVTGGEIVGPASVAFQAVDIAEAYDPRADVWSEVGQMVRTRSRHTATKLLDGRVMVTGGAGQSDSMVNAEIFDPDHDRWSEVSPMQVARFDHTATLLGDGRVLVTGGDSHNIPVDSVEVYDPAYDRWTFVSSMSQKRLNHTATPLGDGRVVVIGGESSGTVAPRTEAYDPATDTWGSLGEPRTNRHGHIALKLAPGIVLVSGGLKYVGSEFVGRPTTSTEVLTIWR